MDELCHRNRKKDKTNFTLVAMPLFIFYFIVFALAWLFQPIPKKYGAAHLKQTIPLLFFAPLIFSFKIINWQMPSFVTSCFEFPWNRYIAVVSEFPLRLALFLTMLYFVRKFFYDDPYFFGFSLKNIKLRPYLFLLFFMLPLILAASVGPDFLQTYPKVRNIDFINGYSHAPVIWKVLYEISHGLDFITIELFFRGFLVLSIVHFVGIDAILRMAVFYGTVHFSKPLGECISSYFGGIALGVIAYRTRSIMGGLIVHLGIAYLMEIGGYLGHIYFNSR
jgi:hypothetical protein